MVRPPSFDSNGMKRGAWSEEEDNKLRAFVQRHGHPNWRLLPSSAGLKRCGKSCRLRWVNYLQPGLKKGKFSKEEEDLIIELHNKHGNKWSVIAENFPGRTDNDIKNQWHAHIKKRVCAEIGQSSGRDANMSAQGHIWTMPPFPEEEFPDFGVHTPTFSHSSDGGDHTCFTQRKVELMEDNFFCLNDMSTFSQGDCESDGSFWSEYAYGDDTLDMVLWQ